MTPTPTALVIRTAGTNCDAELVRAFALAGRPQGWRVETVHLHALVRDPARLERYGLIGFPGGFSYGDDIASGRIFAMRVRERLYPALRAAIERRVPMIGVCNGFQVLVQVGLLPGPGPGEVWPAEAPPPQTVALAENSQARFVDRWVGVRAEPGSRCVWTLGLAGGPDVMQLPVAHGEGRFVVSSAAVLRDLETTGRIALRYTDNYNGSQGSVAGICDSSGLIFGLMPHPERYLDWTRHPYWTRLDAGTRSGKTPGLRIFQNAVQAAGEAARGRPAPGSRLEAQRV
jgi:phosphoribosylformylglycinamidine synthase I